MADIALVWDGLNGRADFAVQNGDLVMDHGLRSALILSLFCDRLAAASDVLPDGGTDRRGWWADSVPAIGGGFDLTGSRLWLLSRALQTNETLRLAEAYAREATRWMLAGNVAKAVTPIASWPRRYWLRLDITIEQPDGPSRYDLEWSAT